MVSESAGLLSAYLAVDLLTCMHAIQTDYFSRSHGHLPANESILGDDTEGAMTADVHTIIQHP